MNSKQAREITNLVNSKATLGTNKSKILIIKQGIAKFSTLGIGSYITILMNETIKKYFISEGYKVLYNKETRHCLIKW